VVHADAWYVTDRVGDHCTSPIGLLFFPLCGFGSVRIATVALTGLAEASRPITKRNRTRGDAGQ
jgi:hypothetical protein